MSILKYLIIVNIITFILKVIDYFLFQKEVHESGGRVKTDMGIKIPWIFNVLETFGGGLGALIAYVILDLRVTKETISSRLYALWWTAVWGFILFSNYNSVIKNKFLNFYKFISNNQIASKLVIMCIAVNVISFITFVINSILKRKIFDTKFQWIIALFGTTGAYIAMDFFNIKIFRNRLSDHVQKGFRFVPTLFSLKIMLGVLLILLTF